MKKIIGFLLLSLSLFVLAGYAPAQMPPLVDRETFFGNPEYAGAQISPDSKYISFIKPLNGTMNVWVKGIDEPFSAARPLSNDQARPVTQYFWSRDSKYVLFVQDKGGDENFNVYAVNPSDKPAASSQVPTARNITDAKGIRAVIFSVPRSDPDVIYVGMNDRDKAWHDLYKVKISTGERTLVMENKDRLGGYVFDNDDKLRLATRSPQNGDTEFLRINADGTTTKIYSCDIFESCGPTGFTKDNKKAYIRTNKGNPDLVELDTLDLDTGNTAKVESDPMGRVDLDNVQFSDITHDIIATIYDDDKTRIVWHDKNYQKDYDFIKSKLGDREVNFVSSSSDETKFVVATTSDVDPGTVWLFDRKTKVLTTLYQIRKDLDRTALSPMSAIRYKSSDGLEIPAYLTIPKGTSGKNLPLLVIPHGGPWARDSWGYNSWAQFWANRGYAVLQPNFRASTGFGKKFLNAGNNEWGQKMQDDITWGVKYLVGQGIADPKRVGIMGGSYGGYATLAAVTFTPDVYSAAVAYCAPSNLQTLLESIPPYWEAGRVIFYKRMADPNNPAGLAQIKRQSPFYFVDKIKTPLMIVQGANDPRVNKREADQMVVALRDRNYPVEYILAPDEGHGFARPVNNMSMFAAAEKFFAKYLGGRYQETMTPEVAKRLGELTVDPRSVTVANSGTTAATFTKTAAATVDLTGKWAVNADAGGQTIELELEFKQVGANFTGTSSAQIGSGTIEGGKINGKTFTAVLHADVQGQPADFQIDGTIDGDKITGTFSNPGFGSIPFSGVKMK